MAEIGAAVLGAGYWGPNLVRNIAVHPAIDLLWVCDLDGDRAARVAAPYRAVASTTSIHEVLADPRVSLVAIATPVTTHASLARECLLAGRHVIVEKPLASSLAEGVGLAELASRVNRLLVCDHTFCYTPSVAKLREFVRGGYVGDILYFDSVRGNLGLFQQDVNVVWDLATHDFAILDHVLPADLRAISVSAVGSDPLSVGRLSVAHITLTLATGALAHIHVNWLSPSKLRTTILCGTERMVVWDDTTPSERLKVYDKGVRLSPPDQEARRQTLISYRVGDMWAPALSEREALVALLDEVVACIATPRAPLTGATSGLRVLAMLEATERSLASKGTPAPIQFVD